MDAEGVTITRDEFFATFGQRNEEILRGWLGPSADAARIQRVGDAKEVAYRSYVAAEGIAPLPGAAEWVRSLHAAGWRQAIASSAPRLNVEVMHEALAFQGLIETLVSAEDVRAGKARPGGIPGGREPAGCDAGTMCRGRGCGGRDRGGLPGRHAERGSRHGQRGSGRLGGGVTCRPAAGGVRRAAGARGHECSLGARLNGSRANTRRTIGSKNSSGSES